VRELAHAVERAVLLAAGDRITAQDLGLQTRTDGATAEDMTLEEAERTLFERF
jgi:DNA-binding NtrC family response regulator